MEEDVKKLISFYKTFNILIIGHPGSGKSTFINKITGEKLCRSKDGKSCTKQISKYYHRSYPLAFYDSPGFESNDKGNTIDIIIALVKEKMAELGREKYSQINCVLYLINMGSNRTFYDNEAPLLKVLFKDFQIPIYFVATKTKEKESQKAVNIISLDFQSIIEDEKIKINEKYKDDNIKNYIFPVELVENVWGIDKLFKQIYNDFKGYIVSEEITSLNFHEKNKKSLLLLKTPEDIKDQARSISKHVIQIYRILAKTINIKEGEQGITNLQIALIKLIGNIYHVQLDTEKCLKYLFSNEYENEKLKEYKLEKFWDKIYSYENTNESHIDYLGHDLISRFEKEMMENSEKIFVFINISKDSLDKAIQSLNELAIKKWN